MKDWYWKWKTFRFFTSFL